MTEHFNQLTPAEAERLAMLAEECGEVIQIIGKILRHGYASHNPKDMKKMPNKFLLSKEMGDVLAVWREMTYLDGVGGDTLHDTAMAWAKKLEYSHHQETPGF